MNIYGYDYRGCKKQVALPFGKKFYHCAEAAGREVWLKRQNGTILPRIIITATVRDGKLRLTVSEGRLPRSQLGMFEELSNYDGGRGGWRTTATKWQKEWPRMYKNKSLRKVWEHRIKKLSPNEYAEISCELHLELNAKLDNWFDMLGEDFVWNPEERLVHYLSVGEILPASMLAHVLLGQLAHEPVKNAGRIFKICAYLNKHPKRDAFKAPVLNGLEKLSQFINTFAEREYKYSGRVANPVLRIHKILLKRGGIILPDEFVHIPDATSLSYLL